MTSYKGTIGREQLRDFLSMLFPKISGEHVDEVLSKGLVPPRYHVPTDANLVRTTSKLELSIYPYAPDPIIVIKDESGSARALEFHASNHSPSGVYEVYEICEEGAELLNKMLLGRQNET